MAATHLTATGTISLPVPACGAGSVTVYGWVYIPAAGVAADNILLQSTGSSIWIQFTSWAGPGGSWVPFYDWNSVAWGWGAEADSWVFVALVYSADQLDVYWRRDGHYDLGHISGAISYNDAMTALLLGSGDGAAVAGDHQYWGCYVGALTEAQLLAQSYSTTQLVAGRSFWALTDNSNDDSVGTYDATLSGSSVASRTAPTSYTAPDTTHATEVVRREGDCADYAGSVTGDPFTVSFWVQLPAADTNAYPVFFNGGTAEDAFGFVCQHTEDATTFNTNCMCQITGQAANDYGMASSTGTLAQCLGWVFVAFVITESGGHTFIQTFTAFGVDGTLTERTESYPEVPWVWPSPSGWALRVGNPTYQHFLKHLRVHASALNSTQLAALMVSDADDTTAWAHYPLSDGSGVDVSGNARHLNVAREWWPGTDGPVLESEPEGITGTGVCVAPAATCTGTAVVSVASAGSVTAPGATVSATGEVSVSGLGAVTAPGATQAATAETIVAGTGAVTAPAATVSATGGVVVATIGACIAPAVTAIGTGTVSISGTADCVAPAATVTGSGSVAIVASGSCVAPAATCSGTATVESTDRVAVGDCVAPAATAAGVGSALVTGAGDCTAPAATTTGQGALAIVAQASCVAPGAISAGTITTTVSASASVVAPAATGSGVVAALVTATASMVAPAATVAGSGTVGIVATGACTAPAATCSGTAVFESDIRVVVGACVAPPATCSGTAVVAVTGAAAVVAPPATAAGTGTVSISGSGTCAASPATATGVALVAVSGSGSVTAPGATVSAIGTVRITASADVVAPGATCSGEGTVEQDDSLHAVGACVAPAATSTGTGTVSVSCSGSATAPGATVIGSGAVAVTASSSCVAPAATASGTLVFGEYRIPGSVALSATTARVAISVTVADAVTLSARADTVSLTALVEAA